MRDLRFENPVEWMNTLQWVEKNEGKYTKTLNWLNNGASTKEEFQTLKPLYLEIENFLLNRANHIESLDIMIPENRVQFVVMLNNLLYHKFKFELKDANI